MKSKITLSRWSLLAVFSLCLIVAVSSCSKKEVKEDEPLINPSGDTGGGQATGSENVDSSALTPSAGGDSAAASGEFSTVYFEFDSYTITASGKSALKSNAAWLKSHSNATVQIEGHCDERGTTEYNLALGERRANAVRDHLVRLGVDKSRLSVISYGEERPSDPGHDEAAWSKNRRAQFVVLSQ